MKNYEFICWLEGYRDLCSDDRVTPKKLRILRNHLNLVRAVEGALGEINESIMQEISRLLDNDVSQEEMQNFLLFAQARVDEVSQGMAD